jgi:DNA-binding NtrC family response regulator
MQIAAANLFIVDDEITVRGLVPRYLLDGGCECHAAGGVTSAENKRARRLGKNTTMVNSLGFGVAL